jgi:hypothetical protein
MTKRHGSILAVQAITLSVAALPALAQDTWLQDDHAYHGKDAAQSNGFAALQIATTEPGQFMADWEKPGAGVKLVSPDRVKRGHPIVTFILFRGCKPDARGACNVTVDFATTGPSGKTYDETKGAEVWVGRPPPPGRAIQLSAGGLGLSFETKDIPGPYRVTARITDHVAAITLQTEKTLTLLAD